MNEPVARSYEHQGRRLTKNATHLMKAVDDALKALDAEPPELSIARERLESIYDRLADLTPIRLSRPLSRYIYTRREK